MAAPPFEIIWQRIAGQQGLAFRTYNNFDFTYRTAGDDIQPNRTLYAIPRSDFESVYRGVPVEYADSFGERIRGFPYIWAILHDPRIRRDDY